MFGRIDPFFSQHRPKTNGYLESLHRTYGQAPLPKRDDATFKRALEFRMQEKQKYADIERQNAQLRTDYEALCMETDRMKQLFEQLSKRETTHEPSSDRDGAHVRDVPADGSKDPPPAPANDSPPDGGGDRGKGDAAATGGKAVGEGSAGVPGEVLQPGVHRQASQHGDEGSEPEPRAGSGASGDDSAAVQEGEGGSGA